MKKEDLIKLKSKLGQLSFLEKKLRDLYLRDISLGNVYGPATGYASIDKPWLKYYNSEDLLRICSKKTMFENLYESNKDNLDLVALNYFGNKITFRSLFDNIEIACLKYNSLGFKAGDVVSICSVCTPEIVYTIYALNKLGIIVNMIDPRVSGEVLNEYIHMSNSSGLVILENLDHLLKGLDIKLKRIVEISSSTSLPVLKKLIVNLKKNDNKQNGLDTIKYDDVEVIDNDISFEKRNADDVAVIVYTGGTTGKPKGVMLTNDNFNQMAFQYRYSQFGVGKGQKFLNIITPTFAYGICNSLHLPLCLGMEVIIIPVFDPKKFGDYVNKYKPNHTLGVPGYWQSFVESKKIQHKDLNYLYSAGCGGDSMTLENEMVINDFLFEHNSLSKGAKGYGMTELSSAVVVCNKKANKLGSVGVPMISSSLCIVSPEDGSELRYNEIGEICLCSPTTMKGYLNNKAETDRLIVNSSDGLRWVHTGDLGYVDEDGNLYIKGRLKRLIIKRGIKVFPTEIEEVISQHYAVKNCCVVGAPDNCWVEVPIAYIELKLEYINSSNQIFAEIERLCREKLKSYSVPHKFILMEIPLTKMGKNDFKKLERIKGHNVANFFLNNNISD